MKKSIGSIFLAFVFLMVLLSGCAPASTPIPPTVTPLPTHTPVPTMTAVPTQTPIPPTATIPVLCPTDTLPIPLSKDDVTAIEKKLFEIITREGVGNRFVIKDSVLTGNNLVEGGLTFSEGAGGATEISTEFPGDVMPFPNVYGQQVWRFRGKVSIDLQKTSGEIYTYKFIGESNDLNLLTFGRFLDIGFVYLRGNGTVIFPDGKEVKIECTE
jgi:hypothetical protein